MERVLVEFGSHGKGYLFQTCQEQPMEYHLTLHRVEQVQHTWKVRCEMKLAWPETRRPVSLSPEE